MSVTTNDLKEGRINDDLGRKLEAASAQLEANVERGRNMVADWQADLSDRSREFGRMMDHYTHEHPWRMISSAFVGALLLGLMCGCELGSRKARF